MYDELFGYGYVTLMNMIMEIYPVAGEGEKITDALTQALDMDPSKVRGDAADVAAWVEGKTESEILAAVAAGDGSIASKAVEAIKGQAEYHHTRPGNIGLVKLMEVAGVKPEKESLERWCEAFGMRQPAVERNAGLLKEYQEKMANAMQMIKAMEIREKKQMADRLEEKAKLAQEKAEGAAKAAEAKAAAEN